MVPTHGTLSHPDSPIKAIQGILMMPSAKVYDTHIVHGSANQWVKLPMGTLVRSEHRGEYAKGVLVVLSLSAEG